MLDDGHNTIEMIPTIDESTVQVELPENWADFYEQRGPLTQVLDDRRRYPRYYYRGLGILRIRGENCQVVTKDLSRCGVGFYHREQLFPLQEAEIWVPGEGFTNIRITHCRRVQRNCYECGAQFILETDRAAAARQIAQALEP